MKKILTVFTICLISKLVFALPFNSKVSEDDLALLAEGKVVARNIDKFKNIGLEGDSPLIERMKEQIKDLSPNYLAELIQIRPYEGNEDLPQKLFEVLSDIEHYAGIQYWSVRHERYYDLYSSAKILKQEQISKSRFTYETDLYMEPFGSIYTPISIEKGEDYLIYTNSNSNSLKIKGMTAVKAHNMKSMILLFKDGDNWILYGIGGCRAPRIAMFESRIETSFINRIKTFCSYVFTKI